jgi:hypothetical protein
VSALQAPYHTSFEAISTCKYKVFARELDDLHVHWREEIQPQLQHYLTHTHTVSHFIEVQRH